MAEPPLQPPSFFQNAVPQEDGESKKEVASATPKALPVNWREEIAHLRVENKLFRKLLEGNSVPGASRFPYLSPRSSPPPSQSTPPIPRSSLHFPQQQQHLPTLTPDLAHVDSLQTRMKEASSRIQELERALLQQKREFHKQIEILNAKHESTVYNVESEKHQLAGEYHAYREEKERQVRHLVAEVSTQRDLNSLRVEQLLAKVSSLENEKSGLESERQRTTEGLREELASVKKQLEKSKNENEKLKNECNTRLNVLMAQVASEGQRVKELESYLGGEIPNIKGKKGSEAITWKEERELLYCEIQKSEHEAQRLHSENKLFSIRLSSLSEILAIQEADMTKRCGEGMESVRSLLTRWREKVFTLLVQRKLQEIEDCREREKALGREAVLVKKVEELEKECQLMSHTLADKTAQCQLEESKNQAMEEELGRASERMDALENQIHTEHHMHLHSRNSVQTLADLCSAFKSNFNQALTQLANYEHRIAFAVKRIQLLKANLKCQQALLSGQDTEGADEAYQQVCGDSRGEEDSTSCLTREQLEHELQTLHQERDDLIGRLGDSTEAFQQQMKSMKEKYLAEKGVLEGHLHKAETGYRSLEQELVKLQHRLASSEEEKGNLNARMQQLEGEMKGLQTSMEARIESKVLLEKQKNKEELGGMEKLLNVARREHSKVIVQLQQLTRELTRDKERAIEAGELKRARLEQELAAANKKLQSVQVERNLLLTTLRQEGIVAPLKSKHVKRPRQCNTHGEAVPPHPETAFSSSSEAESEGDHRTCGTGKYDQKTERDQQPQEDIRDVLKDLQMLSASLLKMEPEPGLGTESDICTSGTELEPGLGTSSSNSGSRTEQDLNQDNSQFS